MKVTVQTWQVTCPYVQQQMILSGISTDGVGINLKFHYTISVILNCATFDYVVFYRYDIILRTMNKDILATLSTSKWFNDKPMKEVNDYERQSLVEANEFNNNCLV